jgi:glycosyltransferase involved in cell wall biosynthesis
MLDFGMRMIDKISVFLPTYNEEGNIKKVVLNTKKILEKIAGEWELLVINDGSNDNTLAVVKEIEKESKGVRVISHAVNKGYGASLQSGFYGARYPWIAFTDSDGQFDFGEISNFIEKQKETGADLVIGYYKKRKVSLSKKITSRLWETLVFIFFGLKVHDVDCGFKFISKKVIDTIPRLESERGAFISSELLIKARKKGFKIVEIPVTHYPRTQGAGTGRNLNVIIKSFVDLFRLWKKLK